MQVDLTGLVNVGAVGVVLAWHLVMIIPRLERIERAIDRQTQAHLLDITTRPGVSPIAKAQAERLNKSISSRYTKEREELPEV